MKVSAIVSLYNAEKYVVGRLENLLSQTLYGTGELEIVCVVSGSKQREVEIIQGVIAQGASITLIQSLRDPLYTAWNIGIRAAKGDYITNANADDRLAPDALERMAQRLDEQPEVELVYGNSVLVAEPHDNSDAKPRIVKPPQYPDGHLNPPEYSALTLAEYCYIGPHPMWRRWLHDSNGYFDETYMLAGDYEFWLRLAASGTRMRRIDGTPLGYFCWREDQLSQEAYDMHVTETVRCLMKWQPIIRGSKQYARGGALWPSQPVMR